MNLERYLSLVVQYTEDYDRLSVARAYNTYIRDTPNADEESACEHIQQRLPCENAICIKNLLSESRPSSTYEIGKAIRWFQQQKILVTDTICGYCVDNASADKLRDFLLHAFPVQQEFDRYCRDLSIESTPAIYADFRRRHGRNLVSTRYHPYLSELDYWLGPVEDLRKLIVRWYMEYSAFDVCDEDGYLPAGDCADILKVKVSKLMTWLWAHPESYVCHHGRCIVPIDAIKKLQNEWKRASKIQDLLAPKLEQIPRKSQSKSKANILRIIQENNPNWILPNDAYPQQQSNVLYTICPLVASRALDNILESLHVLPLKCLKDKSGMSMNVLRDKVSAGCISAIRNDDGMYYISITERKRVEAVHNQYMPLEDVVTACLNNCSSQFSISSKNHRDNLVEFGASHNWWGLDCIRCNEMPIDSKYFGLVVLRANYEPLYDHLRIWIEGYGKSYSEKLKLIVDRFGKQFPETTEKLIKFEQNIHPADKPLIDMVQLLFKAISVDLHTMDDEGIKRLVSWYCSNATIITCKTLSDFLSYGHYTSREFNFDSTGIKLETSAYSVIDFAVMVWHVVNDEVIEKEDLINKAIGTKRYADLWLYIALHVFASWRSTDYIRMVPPLLPYSPEETLDKVKDRSLTNKEAIYIAEYFVSANSLLGMLPNKTKGASGVSKLYFYVPQSCLASFGTILAIATAHYHINQNSSFVVPIQDWYTIKRFFGDEFLRACGNRPFSTRRANKALLQSIEYEGRENSQLPPMVAYHLASIMRSHKLSYGKPSDVTDIYLRDANFTGLTPEYVIYQLWERGVCSFVVDVMLENCYGDKYKRLTVAQKTQAITALGLTPMDAANALQCVQLAQDRAVDVVREVCNDLNTMASVLQAIALGHGIGKDQDGYCLCKATGNACKCSERLGCLGCRYEITTKALLLRYAVIHQHLVSGEVMPSPEQERRKYLYSNITWPAMVEILTHLNSGTNTHEINMYQNLLEEAKSYGFAGNRTL